VVFATQNPVDAEGTFALPESQLDRFLIKIMMHYPEEAEELELAARTLTADAPELMIDRGEVRPLLTPELLLEMRAAMDGIETRPAVVRYATALARFTRGHSAIQVGAGPRATQALLLSARVHAALCGRDAVAAEDVQRMALPCLEHRLILKPEFVAKGLTCAEAVRHVLQSVPAPR